MSLLGPDLRDLTLGDVQRFLDGADAEALLWEAKGTDMRKDGIRKAVCAFANGRQTAYLILGADKEGDSWQLNGVDLHGDPPAWVSDVIHDGLDPVPLIDVRPLPVADGLHVAVVEVPPVAIPPCISRGTVWERVSGRTIQVQDSARLSELYGRGQRARDNARIGATGGAEGVLADPELPGHDANYLRFTLAVSATSNPPDISSRLFSQTFERSLFDVTSEHLSNVNRTDAWAPRWTHGMEQSNRWLYSEDANNIEPCVWSVRVIWDGTAVVFFLTESEHVAPETLALGQVAKAWRAATELVEALHGSGPFHMELRVDGREAMRGRRRAILPVLKLARDHLSAPDDAAFTGIERELRRSTGERVYEPDPDAAASDADD